MKVKNKKLTKIFTDIKKAYKKIDVQLDDIQFVRANEFEMINQLHKNRFFPDEIIEHIQEKLIYCFVIKFMNTTINFFTDKHMNRIVNNIDPTVGIINTICRLVFLVRTLMKNSNHLELNYFDCPHKKVFPKHRGEMLNEGNCNSGSSYVGNYQMYVYRREEYKRVVIHELIHSFLGDYHLIEDEFNLKLQKYFCLDDLENININETYTETFATVINMVFTVLERGDGVRDLGKYFDNEFKHSVKVLVSILRHYRYTSIEQLVRQKKGDCKILQQGTSVFNYYVMKPFMLANLDGLLSLNNKCSKDMIYFGDVGCLKAFYDLIIKSFNNKELKEYIDKALTLGRMKTNKLVMVFYEK